MPVHAKNHRDDVKVQRFSTHKGEEDGVLTHAAHAWVVFLESMESLPGQAAILQQCRRAVLVLLAETWVENFIREPPRWPAARMLSVLWADEAAVRMVQGIETHTLPELASFLEVLSVLRHILQSGRPVAEWDDFARAEATLQKLLGEDTGRALVQAFWQALSH